jgi:hypothetical protein
VIAPQPRPTSIASRRTSNEITARCIQDIVNEGRNESRGKERGGRHMEGKANPRMS